MDPTFDIMQQKDGCAMHVINMYLAENAQY